MSNHLLIGNQSNGSEDADERRRFRRSLAQHQFGSIMEGREMVERYEMVERGDRVMTWFIGTLCVIAILTIGGAHLGKWMGWIS